MGIKRTYEKMDQASVVLFIDEISDDADSINKRSGFIRKMIKDKDKHLIILINKSDQSAPERQSELSQEIILDEKDTLLFISAREKTGLDELRLKLGDTALKEKLDSDDVIITNIRHYEALLQVSSSLERVLIRT